MVTNVHAALRDTFASCENALQLCETVSLTAETPCSSARRFRWLRKRPAALRDGSAPSGNALRLCRNSEIVVFGTVTVVFE